VATGLLALMLVTVMVLFGQMLESTTKNAMMSQGAFFADRVVEAEISRLKATNATGNFNSQEWISSTDETNKTTYLYHVESESLATSPLGTSYAIRAEVRWWQGDVTSPEATRKGYGKLSLKRSRVVYIPN
jgi:hypothetical protein